MAKTKRLVFSVLVRGDIPFDMMRYDHCWPRRQEDVANLTSLAIGQVTDADVQFCMDVESWSGGEGQGPTTDRWASFGHIVKWIEPLR